MTTDPSDLVLDPTCGAGTTAFVAERWGRRWITIDTSRVALALARARIMGARYPFYLLADSREGARTVPTAITINVHHSERLLDVDSDSHDLLVSYEGDRTVIELSRLETRKETPFELMFSLGSEYDATLLAHAGPEVEGAVNLL